jgi:thiosulfate reductase cytochrome b subunit
MTNATKRVALRWIHMVFSIPVLGYIYGPNADVQQYAFAVRFIFLPVILLSGLWMYAGEAFALLAVALWLGAYGVGGSGAAILSQVALLIVWKAWSATRALKR